METLITDNITVDKLPGSLFNDPEIELSILRLDKIHPVISGNKWFKLKYYLEDAKRLNKKNIVTFGGAWSNHITAAAAICQLNGLNAIGIIRGEKPPQLSPTLQHAKEMGMQLVFITRDDYQNKKIPPVFLSEEYYLINEGGYGIRGAEGAATIPDTYDKEAYTHIVAACGTGTMLAGLIRAALPHQHITGISVLKNNHALEESIKSLLPDLCGDFQLIHDYHFGGYAKYTTELISFMNSFYQETGIPADFVYTGKLFFAVTDLIKKGIIPSGSRVLAIHSGGLQGNLSLKKGSLIF